MKRIKKVLSLLLTVTLVMGLIPFGMALAAEPTLDDLWTYSVSVSGDTVNITDYKAPQGAPSNVVVPSAEDFRQKGLINVQTVKINWDALHNSGKNATSVEISDTDGNNKVIFDGDDMSELFYYPLREDDDYINKIESIDLSRLDTSKVTDMGSLFWQCGNLKSVNLEGVDTSNVTYMDGMFCMCVALEELDVSGFNTEKVTFMNAMFDDCQSLKKLDISNFKTAPLEAMDRMFCNCYDLEELNLGNGLDTSKVTYMRSVFSGLHKIETLDVSALDTSHVDNMVEMFSGCYSLKTLDLSNFSILPICSGGSSFIAADDHLETIIYSSKSKNLLVGSKFNFVYIDGDFYFQYATPLTLKEGEKLNADEILIPKEEVEEELATIVGVQWASDNDVVSVDENGIVTGVKEGSGHINATVFYAVHDEGDDKIGAYQRTVSCEVNVTKGSVNNNNVKTGINGSADGSVWAVSILLLAAVGFGIVLIRRRHS